MGKQTQIYDNDHVYAHLGNLLSGRALRGANAADEPRQAAAKMIARIRTILEDACVVDRVKCQGSDREM